MSFVIFDLDHTLLSSNASYRFGTYLYKKKFFSFFSMLYCMFSYALHKVGNLSVQQLHQQIFKHIFLGKDSIAIFEDVKAFLDADLQGMIYQPALAKLQKALQAGHCVAIYSSSPDFLVKAISKRLGVNYVESTFYEVDVQKRFSKVSKVLDGSEKALVATKICTASSFSRDDLVVYTDSYLDLPLILIAGKIIAVNPDRQLKSLAQKRGWEIL